jgi:hypothetical protein
MAAVAASCLNRMGTGSTAGAARPVASLADTAAGLAAEFSAVWGWLRA